MTARTGVRPLCAAGLAGVIRVVACAFLALALAAAATAQDLTAPASSQQGADAPAASAPREAPADATAPDPLAILAEAKVATGGAAWDALRSQHSKVSIVSGSDKGSAERWASHHDRALAHARAHRRPLGCDPRLRRFRRVDVRRVRQGGHADRPRGAGAHRERGLSRSPRVLVSGAPGSAHRLRAPRQRQRIDLRRHPHHARRRASVRDVDQHRRRISSSACASASSRTCAPKRTPTSAPCRA